MILDGQLRAEQARIQSLEAQKAQEFIDNENKRIAAEMAQL